MGLTHIIKKINKAMSTLDFSVALWREERKWETKKKRGQEKKPRVGARQLDCNTTLDFIQSLGRVSLQKVLLVDLVGTFIWSLLRVFCYSWCIYCEFL